MEIIPARAASFMDKYKPAEQLFTGDADAGFEITGEQGMKVKFPAGAFLDADGLPVSGEVTVRLIELYSKTDIMLAGRSEEHTSELQSLMRISYAVFCLKKKKVTIQNKAGTK